MQKQDSISLLEKLVDELIHNDPQSERVVALMKLLGLVVPQDSTDRLIMVLEELNRLQVAKQSKGEAYDLL